MYNSVLLLIGVAIGAHCRSPHVAIWMAALGTGLMVAHDMLFYSIVFVVTTAWALRASRKREVSEMGRQEAIAKSESMRKPVAGHKRKPTERN